jgi:hypothetical protein
MENENYVVDANPRKLADGQMLLYFKSTGFNTVQHPAQLWVAKLDSKGTTMTSSPINLVNQTASWEARNGVGCIEAPALLQTGGKTRLFYSGGDWTAGIDGVPYSIGYADCDTPMGPCRKVRGSDSAHVKW